MSEINQKGSCRHLMSRVILLGVLGLLTSGCPLMMPMMIPMMGGMNDSQHETQQKQSSPDAHEDETASKTKNTASGH